MAAQLDAAQLPAADGPDEGLSRRERKRRDVRDRLYGAAVELFTEQGFEATTMEAIAERVDLSRATVFNHFAQKVSFLEEWGIRRRAHVRRVFDAGHITDESASEQLRRYIGELGKLNVASREQTIVLMSASWRFGAVLQDRSLGIELGAIVREGIGRGEFRSDLDPEQTGALLAAGYLATVLRWISDEPAPFSLAEQLESMLDVVLRGALLSGTGHRTETH
jgi:AcrR family transcriptional regulator